MNDPKSTAKISPEEHMIKLSRETKIHRDASGRWFNEGVAITHPGLVRAFDRWITRADDGRYCLKNSINWAYITIEGAPLFVRNVTLNGDGFDLSVSDGNTYKLDPTTLSLDDEGGVYCNIRERQLQARFDSAALVALGNWMSEDAQGTYLKLAGKKYYLVPLIKNKT